MSKRIAYCKIFPPIGIARVGNSESPKGFFIAPDGVDAKPPTQYKDAEGAVLRQAARFRVYGFDSSDRLVKEITFADATVRWKARLANKKAAWFEFSGAAKAIEQFNSPKSDAWPRRNKNVRDSKERTRLLSIDPGKPIEICGKNQAADPTDLNKYAFVGKFQDAVDVYLGELRTDEAGRLLVLGGKGESAAINRSGEDISGERWILHYANNDFWHDDVSDGPVTCSVEIDGRSVRVKGGAWVIVTPPDFAPAVENIVTLFDVVEAAAVAYRLPHPGLPKPNDASAVEFWRDIYPILSRADKYSWVSDLGLRGHAKGKGGDFSDPQLLGRLANLKDEDGKLLRKSIFSRIRTPIALTRNRAEAVAQANGHFMPALSGDEGDATTGSPETWLTVTELQYARLQKWSDNDFTPGTRPDGSHRRVNIADEPGIITRTVLEACAGGAFFPGIEMTAIAREKALYSEAFRIAEGFEAGDITKYMALPWQADFFECNTHWWPAQRPDSVITAKSMSELKRAFSYERKQGSLDRLMLVRQPWARGVDNPRPNPDVVASRLLPMPVASETLARYLGRLTEIVTGTLRDLTSAAVRVKPSSPERVDSLARTQFLIQEQFDVYSGRYFHFQVPSAVEFLNQKVNPRGSTSASESRMHGTEMEAKQNDPTADVAKMLERNTQYVDFIVTRLEEYVRRVFDALVDRGDTAAAYRARLERIGKSAGSLTSGPADLEASIRKDFDEASSEFRTLRLLDMAQCAFDRMYVQWTTRSGDNGMVRGWSQLGFVVEKQLAGDEKSGEESAMANVETERSRLDGQQFRDYYYMLCNIDHFPEMYEYSAKIVEKFLRETSDLIKREALSDPENELMEVYFEYSPTTFGAKLEEIYEYYRERGQATKPWEMDETRAELLTRFVQIAPFNQNDGAWLRFVSNAGPSDDVRGLLFEVWSDEIGNGNPALHHGNLYTTFLRSLDIALPDVTSREYADYAAFSDDRFATTVLELAISQNSDRYFPEILGMTLQLEWEVLSLVSGIKRYDYHGFNSQFWRMHVGIDNAVDGHGGKARKAVEIYLDKVLKESGVEAMRREWQRIWNGFVAFATAGYNYMGNGLDATIAQRRPKTVYDQMADMVAAKQHYGSLNHADKMLGVNRINDWFDDVDGFLAELAHSAWITPGDPAASRLMNYLTTFNGPMYEVFNADDLALWRSWIQWLAQFGDTAISKNYQTKAESMLMLLQYLRSSSVGSDGHARFRLGKKVLRDWFAGDLKLLMRALAEQGNPWVLPFDAGNSPLIRDFAVGTNKMGQMLDRRFAGLGGQAGRLVVVRWINAGCPLPGDKAPLVPRGRAVTLPRRQSLMEKYGIGAVH